MDIGTPGNDFWTIVGAGDYELDGLDGIDTVDLNGIVARSNFSITKSADGAVHVDTISGASDQLHLVLFNIERLTFNGREQVDLTTFFGSPPTVSFAVNAAGVVTGNYSYTLTFNASVTGLSVDDFTVINGSVAAVSGSGSRYTVVVAPAADTEGAVQLALKNGAVVNGSGLANAAALAAPQAIDTRAPVVVGGSPGNDAGEVGLASNIVLSFSEAIQRGSGAVLVKDGGGNVVASFDVATSPNLGISGSTLTIDPSANLPGGTHFSVELAAGSIKDLAGNAAPVGQVLRFVTAIDPAHPALNGTLGNDVFNAGSGDLAIDGLAGIDLVAFNGARAAYSVVTGVGGVKVEAPNAGGTDQLSHIERLQFNDGSLALDIDGHAGLVARILGAVFGPPSVGNQVYVGIGLALLDGGMAYEDLCALAMRAAGKSSPDDVVTLLWTNVVGSPPTAEDKAPFVKMLDEGTTVGALTALAANTNLNVEHVDLVGLAGTGLAFVPYLGG